MSHDELNTLTSVEKILAWMQAAGIPANQLDLIQQDEFCFDMLLPWQDRWLVFGVS